jgi:hypothetical protein
VDSGSDRQFTELSGDSAKPQTLDLTP